MKNATINVIRHWASSQHLQTQPSSRFRGQEFTPRRPRTGLTSKRQDVQALALGSKAGAVETDARKQSWGNYEAKLKTGVGEPNYRSAPLVPSLDFVGRAAFDLRSFVSS